LAQKNGQKKTGKKQKIQQGSGKAAEQKTKRSKERKKKLSDLSCTMTGKYSKKGIQDEWKYRKKKRRELQEGYYQRSEVGVQRTKKKEKKKTKKQRQAAIVDQEHTVEGTERKGLVAQSLYTTKPRAR